MTKILLLSAREDAASRIAADGWAVSRVAPRELDVARAAAAHRVAVADLASAPEALDVALALRAANGSLEFVALAADERGAVDAVRKGAFDAIPWPDDPLEARLMIEAAMRATAPPSSAADGIGGYVFRKRLAIGGMAEVYLADSPKRPGYVVVKCLLPSLAKDHEFVEMFAVEARTSAQLVHPNVVRVVDWGAEGERLFIALEWIDGWDLDRVGVAMRWRFPPAIACHVVAEVCSGLAYAHALVDPAGHPLSLVHRDLNPPNVLLSRAGEVRVSDFGIAKSAYSTVQTQHGIIKGKVDWFSPEQVEGIPLDGRSDVFSAGTLLHLLLTGTHPFRGVTRIDTMNRIRDARYTPPSELRAGLHAELDAIVAKTLARDRDERYASASDLEAALRGVVLSLGGVSRDDLARFLHEAMGEPTDLRATEATILSPPRAPSGEATVLKPPPSENETIVRLRDPLLEAETTRPRRSVAAIAMGLAVPAAIALAFGAAQLVAPAAPTTSPTATAAATTTRIARATDEPARTPSAAPSVAPSPAPQRTTAATPRPAATAIATTTARAATTTSTPAATPRIAAAPKNGTLSIWMAQGWAAISVDGKSLGLNAPRVGIPIPEGKHRVTLENPALGFRRDYDVTIVAGKESRIQVTPEGE